MGYGSRHFKHKSLRAKKKGFHKLFDSMVLKPQKRSKSSGVVAAHLLKNEAPAPKLVKFNNDVPLMEFLDSKLPAPAFLRPEAFHDHSCQNCLESLAAPARMPNANGSLTVLHLIYPLVMTNVATENGHLIIVSFPIKTGDFP